MQIREKSLLLKNREKRKENLEITTGENEE